MLRASNTSISIQHQHHFWPVSGHEDEYDVSCMCSTSSIFELLTDKVWSRSLKFIFSNNDFMRGVGCCLSSRSRWYTPRSLRFRVWCTYTSSHYLKYNMLGTIQDRLMRKTLFVKKWNFHMFQFRLTQITPSCFLSSFSKCNICGWGIGCQTSFGGWLTWGQAFCTGP